MKKTIIITLLFTAINLIANAQSTVDKWPQLKAYHKVMSATFHPAEEGNLKPIKAKSAELSKLATALKNSIPPKEFNTKSISTSVQKLATESAALNTLVKKKSKDAAILKSLTALHHRFHEIVGLCKEEKH